MFVAVDAGNPPFLMAGNRAAVLVGDAEFADQLGQGGAELSQAFNLIQIILGPFSGWKRIG